jgi:sialic acid synthase
MILEASRAGVDCVKFQKSCLPAKFTQSALTRPYSSPNAFGTTYGEHKRHLEFTIEQFRELKDYAESCGLVFSASAMDSVCKFISIPLIIIIISSRLTSHEHFTLTPLGFIR